MHHAVSRPVELPLFGITSEGKCACGWKDCSRIGKHTAVNWREIKYGDELPEPAPGAGFALKTGAHPLGSDIFVVDLDGVEAAGLFDSMGPCPETFTVTSPREGGGWHLYFKHPGFFVKTSVGSKGGLADGIDIRGDKGIIIGPGSPHASGGRYEITEDVPIADAPEWLLTWLRTQKDTEEVQVYPGDVTDPKERARRQKLYAEYLRVAPPCVKGQGGDTTLFPVVQRGAYDLALPTEDVLDLIREHYDPRCDPPWGSELDERVRHKARSAKEGSTRPRAEPWPEDLEHLGSAGPAPSVFTFDPVAKGEVANVAKIIGTPGARGIGTFGGWDEHIDPPVYLVDGLIPENKVSLFYAEGGSLKSWAAFHLGICVTTGEPFLGHPVKKGRVLILDYEDARYEYQRRMRILRHGKLDPLPDLGHAYWPGKLEDVGFWTELSHQSYEDKTILLIIDTLGSGISGGVDENSREFSEAVKLAGKFTEIGSSVLIVAHANKAGGLRGHSSIRDSADCAFNFVPVSDTDDVKRMRMVCDKPGPQKKPKPVNIELSDKGLTTFVDEAADMARNATTVDTLENAITLQLQSGPLTQARLARVLRRNDKEVGVAVRLLVGEGKVRSLGKFEGYILDGPEDRRKRVLQAAKTFHGTRAGLAKEAYAPVDLVTRMIDIEKVVAESGSGYQVRAENDSEE